MDKKDNRRVYTIKAIPRKAVQKAADPGEEYLLKAFEQGIIHTILHALRKHPDFYRHVLEGKYQDHIEDPEGAGIDIEPRDPTD